MKKTVLSGMRPTGKLHLGHWVGALSNWVNLQEDYQCFFMVADWHALMSEYKDPKALPEYILDNVSDWLSWGISPDKAVVFVQSEVTEHLELYMVFSLFTPLGWLFRCPTFKEQISQLKDKDIHTYAFLGYPVLQAADILAYKADFVPVGEDQLPHLELCREIVRRFQSLYESTIFPEPQPLLTLTSRLLGLDGRKMSKSYGNYISLDEEDKNIRAKVLSMITDPQRIRKEDRGHPEICNVYAYYKAFKPQIEEEVYDWCSQARKGCVECKTMLADILIDFIRPHREKKKELLAKKDLIYDILNNGRNKARALAKNTLEEVKEVLRLKG